MAYTKVCMYQKSESSICICLGHTFSVDKHKISFKDVCNFALISKRFIKKKQFEFLCMPTVVPVLLIATFLRPRDIHVMTNNVRSHFKCKSHIDVFCKKYLSW